MRGRLDGNAARFEAAFSGYTHMTDTATAPGSPLHRRKVLVVEDEVIISFLIEDLLSEISCDVSLAATVPSAMKLLDAGAPRP